MPAYIDLEELAGMSEPLWQLAAVDAAKRIARREMGCLELVESHLARMDEVNDDVNAVTVALHELAREQARAAGATVAAGEPLGPLHGVPVTIKENVDQAGQATTNGVRAFADVIAKTDAPVVANLRRAGAVIIGRTNTPEFSLRWFTDNPLRGLTRNPWDPGRTPGGSSGGAAAAVAMGIGCVAHGNDLGGSLRYPAYCCGLATIRPSLGRVPACNPSASEERPLGTLSMSVQGPIAREVRDVRVALRAMAAADSRDPWHTPLEHEYSRTSERPRVAACADPFGNGEVDPAVSGAVHAAAEALRGAGYEVEEVMAPNFAEMAQAWGRLLATELHVKMLGTIREHAHDDARQVVEGYVEHYTPLDLSGYMHALADRTRLMREFNAFLDRFPLAVWPVSLARPLPVNHDLGGAQTLRELVGLQAPQYVINYLALPAAAVPTGVVDGLPAGVQIVGPRFREDLCLDAAEAIEGHTGVLTHNLWRRGCAPV
ncbi:MAG: amidase [Gammaproteobacteria bacterium]